MAKQSAWVWDESYKANSDLSAKFLQAVKLTAQDVVDLCSAATDACFGILQNKPTQNHAAVVRHLGKTKAVSDGSGTTINVGDFVGTDANGRMIKKATADFGVLGRSNGPQSAAVGIIIEVILLPQGVFRTLVG